MKCLLILALAAAAHAQSFFPRDTPEVEAAKAAHFAEHARAAAAVGAPLQDVYRSGAFRHFADAVPIPVADTPEVAAAKAAHLAEHARLAAPFARFADAGAAFDPYAEYRAYYNNYYRNLGRSVYTGPQAVPTVLPSGYLADTPEVAHAKATHIYKHYQESIRV